MKRLLPLLAGIVLVLPVLPALAGGRSEAATVTPVVTHACGLATSGTFGRSLCWLDFTGYRDHRVRDDGQRFAETLPGGDTLSFELTRTGTPGVHRLAADAVPATAGAPFGTADGGAYAGIPGAPALFPRRDTPRAGGSWQLTFGDLRLTDAAGTVLGGWSLDVADAGQTDAGASIRLTTDGGGWQVIDTLSALSPTGRPPCGTGPTGVGTATFTCAGGPGDTGPVGAVIAATGGAPGQVGVTLADTGAGREGVAVAVSLATVSAGVAVAGRVVATDQFGVTVGDAGGTVTGSATTAGAATSADTGAVTVPAGTALTVAQRGAGGTDLAGYAVTWRCTSTAPGGTTTVTAGSGVPPPLVPALGVSAACTFTDAPLPRAALALGAGPGPELVAVGRSVPVALTVTATGAEPVHGVAVTVTGPTGGGRAGAVACPSATLAAGASETCTTSWTVAEADLAAGTVTLSATATATGADGTDAVSPAVAVTMHAAALGVTVAVRGGPVDAPGQVVDLAATVTDGGPTAVDRVALTVADGGLPDTVSCPAAVLAAGSAETCTVAVTTTEATLVSGALVASVTAGGTTPTGQAVASPPADVMPSVQVPVDWGLVVVDATTSAVRSGGSLSGVVVQVADVGPVALGGIAAEVAVGTGPPVPASCPEPTLPPGATERCTVTLPVPDAAVRGVLVLTALARATSPVDVTAAPADLALGAG